MSQQYQLDIYNEFVKLNLKEIQGGEFRWFWQAPRIRNGDLSARIQVWLWKLEYLLEHAETRRPDNFQIDMPSLQNQELSDQDIANKVRDVKLQLETELQTLKQSPQDTASKAVRQLAESVGISTELPSTLKPKYLQLLAAAGQPCKYEWAENCPQLVNTSGELRTRTNNIDKTGQVDMQVYRALFAVPGFAQNLATLWVPQLTLRQSAYALDPDQLLNTQTEQQEIMENAQSIGHVVFNKGNYDSDSLSSEEEDDPHHAQLMGAIDGDDEFEYPYPPHNFQDFDELDRQYMEDSGEDSSDMY